MAKNFDLDEVEPAAIVRLATSRCGICHGSLSTGDRSIRWATHRIDKGNDPRIGVMIAVPTAITNSAGTTIAFEVVKLTTRRAKTSITTDRWSVRLIPSESPMNPATNPTPV